MLHYVPVNKLPLLACDKEYWGRAPPAGGSGFPFQVLATRTSWLRAFHYNPSRKQPLTINPEPSTPTQF